MANLDCAIELLELLGKSASVNGIVSTDEVEAVARAIMALGRSEGYDDK